MKPADLAYWNVNLPPSKHTADCPEALRTVGDKDRGIIGTLDADYAVMSWEDVCQLVAAMRLDQLRRVPSQLRAYLIYCWDLRKSHGSVMAFLLRERLSWSLPLQPSGKPPFEDPEDIRILWNDWPYGIDPKIVHLVVWTKFELEDDPVTGLVSDKARRQIDEFVAKTFYGRVPRERVVWFKNWASLKSVNSVEHFHVMLLDPDLDFVDEVTGGDIPMFRRLLSEDSAACQN